MNSLEILKDSEGKETLINNNIELPDKQTMGQNLENFEILKLLGKGVFGKVYKVQSKLNKKIYAMRKIDLKEIKEKDSSNGDNNRFSLNEVMHLQELSYSHIIKYYQTFKEEDNLYIINEYISNGDMSELIKTRSKLNKPFEEEELWNIFLQCIMTLYYIHKKGIIHRHIKPSNIFIDENMKIKIGDFGFLFLEPDKYNDQKIKYLKGPYISENSNVNTPNAKEIELNKYDQKIDVYALGMSFFEMAFFHKGELSENDKKLNYSETLKNIIFLMMEEDKDKRMTSEQIYERIGIEYSRIAKNSSIDAMITCLNTLNTLNQELKNKVESNKQFYQNKPIVNVYLECIKFMQNKDIDFSQWEYNVNNFRKQLGLENLKFEGTKEIDPMILFEYIMKKLFEETNTIKHIEPNYNFGPHLINSDEGLKEIEENEARLKFDNLFEKFDSPIINNLKGLMRQTNTCSTCNIKTYKFSCYFYVNFNLEKILKKKTINVLDLEDTFRLDNKFNEQLFCSKCFKKTEHNCNKEFYSFPKLLVIYIQRGIISMDKMEVNIKKNLEVNNLENKTTKKFNLMGLINKISKDNDEHYLSNFYINNNWFRSERYKNMKPIEPPYQTYEKLRVNGGVNDEDTVMLFYTSE